MSRYLSITVDHPRLGSESYFRPMRAAVGGRMCKICPGTGIRAATLNELRQLDRLFLKRAYALLGLDGVTVSFKIVRY